MLRSINKAFEEIKAQDPKTSITVHTIRVWCQEHKIKFLMAGKKTLIDMESLLAYIGQNK